MINISLKDYLTASGKYPDRENSSELTPEKLDNEKKLLVAVNALLAEAGILSVSVSSGFRPQAANTAAGGAKNSLHGTCLAIDLLDDKSQSLANKMTPELLRKHDLFMENEAYTKGKFTNWVHLQKNPNMKDRPSRRFIP